MENKDKIKRTKKRGDIIILPSKETTIFQNNKITNGHYKGFSLIQSKVLLSLIKQLQIAIKADMDGANWQQMQLFKFSPNRDLLEINIPLSDIGAAYQYKEIADSAKSFTSLSISIKGLEGYESVAALAARVDTPKKVNGKATIKIHLLREVAEKIIAIDKNDKGKPIRYTSYMFEIGMRARNKYTYKIYWLISSWKGKGGFKISYEELRNQLGIEPDEYPQYKDFKKRVLIPVQNELEKKSDCWFNCSASDFEIRHGKKVTALNFKVITPEFEDAKIAKFDNVRQLLIIHASFSLKHIVMLNPLFVSDVDINDLTVKCMELITLVKSKGSAIKNKPAYIIQSLKTYFSEYITENAEVIEK